MLILTYVLLSWVVIKTVFFTVMLCIRSDYANKFFAQPSVPMVILLGHTIAFYGWFGVLYWADIENPLLGAGILHTSLDLLVLFGALVGFVGSNITKFVSNRWNK